MREGSQNSILHNLGGIPLHKELRIFWVKEFTGRHCAKAECTLSRKSAYSVI
jgi:hypothetical protein